MGRKKEKEVANESRAMEGRGVGRCVWWEERVEFYARSARVQSSVLGWWTSKQKDEKLAGEISQD